jgi:hypothetical protein
VAGPAKRPLHGTQQIDIPKWLRQIDYLAGLSNLPMRLRPDISAHQDDGDWRAVCACVAGHDEPIDPGKVKISHDEIRAFHVEARDRVFG